MFKNVLQGVYAPVTLLKCSLPLLSRTRRAALHTKLWPHTHTHAPTVRSGRCVVSRSLACAGGGDGAGVLGASAATQSHLGPKLLHSP